MILFLLNDYLPPFPEWLINQKFVFLDKSNRTHRFRIILVFFPLQLLEILVLKPLLFDSEVFNLDKFMKFVYDGFIDLFLSHRYYPSFPAVLLLLGHKRLYTMLKLDF